MGISAELAGFGGSKRPLVIGSQRPLLVVMLLALLSAFGWRPPAVAAQAAAAPVLHWSPCEDVPDTECTGLDVPVDPARPDGQQFSLRLGRVPASDPAHRQGVLLIIPGGPGAGIAETIGGENRSALHIDELAGHYDVVTFDPRGIGKSSPILCGPSTVPVASEPALSPPLPADFALTAAINARLFASCFAATGELMAHLSAMDTAADVERIRQALTPSDGLVAYGASYGSAYGAAYLERYGEHVKALVLDAVVDHSVDFPTFIARNLLSVQDGFDRFSQWCAKESTCALHDRDLGAVFDAAALKAPVVRRLVPQLLAAAADPNLGWPAVAQMLAQVSGGDTSKLDAIAGVASLSSASADPWIVAGKNALFAGVICADFGPQRDFSALAAAGAALARQAPRFAWRFWDSTPIAHGTAGVGDCVGWPKEATNPPHRLQVGSHPNVMVANSTHDSQTPLINALSVWLQIPDARLLIADVDGHQSLILSQCAYRAELRFLGDPTSAAATTLCPN
jgi:pimeloyl-ACP methyl ester carboxylesterase